MRNKGNAVVAEKNTTTKLEERALPAAKKSTGGEERKEWRLSLNEKRGPLPPSLLREDNKYEIVLARGKAGDWNVIVFAKAEDEALEFTEFDGFPTTGIENAGHFLAALVQNEPLVQEFLDHTVQFYTD